MKNGGDLEIGGLEKELKIIRNVHGAVANKACSRGLGKFLEKLSHSSCDYGSCSLLEGRVRRFKVIGTGLEIEICSIERIMAIFKCEGTNK